MNVERFVWKLFKASQNNFPSSQYVILIQKPDARRFIKVTSRESHELPSNLFN